MRSPKLIRLRICPDANSDEPLSGDWHTGWRKPGRVTVAFRFRARWYAVPDNGALSGPFRNREEALAA